MTHISLSALILFLFFHALFFFFFFWSIHSLTHFNIQNRIIHLFVGEFINTRADWFQINENSGFYSTEQSEVEKHLIRLGSKQNTPRKLDDANDDEPLAPSQVSAQEQVEAEGGEEDDVCVVCGSDSDPTTLLLCDECNSG
jgi:hypothetical protein